MFAVRIKRDNSFKVFNYVKHWTEKWKHISETVNQQVQTHSYHKRKTRIKTKGHKELWEVWIDPSELLPSYKYLGGLNGTIKKYINVILLFFSSYRFYSCEQRFFFQLCLWKLRKILLAIKFFQVIFLLGLMYFLEPFSAYKRTRFFKISSS